MSVVLRGDEAERLRFIADSLERGVFALRDHNMPAVADYFEALAQVARGERNPATTPASPRPPRRRKLRLVTQPIDRYPW